MKKKELEKSFDNKELEKSFDNLAHVVGLMLNERILKHLEEAQA